MASQSILILLACIMLISSIPACDALACYVSEGDLAVIEENPEWTYCVMTPKSGSKANGTRFGVGPKNDDLGFINANFNVNMPFYRLIAFCYLEKYNLHLLMRASAEVSLRCICNYDLCNAETELYKYFATLGEESMFRGDRK
ncbi:hypothetical protein Ddc_17301 [Ditylenchus destructor]|nr:hypothetical protein Ddc_17301 [Ditylenchus destructor]